jgi:hypothetical protein
MENLVYNLSIVLVVAAGTLMFGYVLKTLFSKA